MFSFVANLHAPNLVEYLTQVGYLGVAIWFLVFDFVAPFPDEISLLTVGYLSAIGVFNPLIAGGIALSSFLLTDTFSFFVVRNGARLFGRKLKRPTAHSVRAFVTRNLEQHLPKTLIIICFIPRMRLWGPLVAGSIKKISYKRFITFDAIGVAGFTGFYCAIGYFFGMSLTAIFQELKVLQTSIFVGILFILGLILIYISDKAGWQKA